MSTHAQAHLRRHTRCCEISCWATVSESKCRLAPVGANSPTLQHCYHGNHRSLSASGSRMSHISIVEIQCYQNNWKGMQRGNGRNQFHGWWRKRGIPFLFPDEREREKEEEKERQRRFVIIKGMFSDMALTPCATSIYWWTKNKGESEKNPCWVSVFMSPLSMNLIIDKTANLIMLYKSEADSWAHAKSCNDLVLDSAAAIDRTVPSI